MTPRFLGWSNALEWNEIGDSFGMLNTLFSALAFAFIIYTSIIQKEELMNQRRELELQREELKLTREELSRSAKAQNELAKLTSDQLNLDSANRRSDIKPGLKIFQKKNIGNYEPHLTVSMVFKVIDNQLTIVSIVSDDESMINVGFGELHLAEKIYNKTFFENNTIDLHFNISNKKIGQTFLSIKLRDKDSNLYEARLRFKIRKGGQFDVDIASIEYLII